MKDINTIRAQVTCTPREAAQLVGVGRSTIYELIREGKITAHKRGARTLITVANLITLDAADIANGVKS
jgi:excisionase family DNA binding protein